MTDKKEPGEAIRIYNNPCLECGAACCQYYQFQVFWPHLSEEDFKDQLSWVMAHENTQVSGIIPSRRAFIIKVCARCAELDANNKCTGYEHRPAICRGYECRACESYREDGYYTITMIHNITNKMRADAKRIYEEYKAKGLAGKTTEHDIHKMHEAGQ